jgi:thiaminase/transcriptional activator TenA
MRFTDELWRSIEGIYSAIVRHPFNTELAAGTLAHEKFVFYIQQDALYLLDFGKSLAIMAGRSTTPRRLLQFTHYAEQAVAVERALHESYFRLFGIEQPRTTPSPACFAYTNYLLATVSARSYEEGAAALLPCFWIYREVGNHILQHAVAGNPYQKWIDTYASPEFAELVEHAIALVDECAQQSSETGRHLMRQAFITSSQLEWWFWDSAYRMEEWLL